MITSAIVVARPAAQNVPPGVSLPAGPAGPAGLPGTPGAPGLPGVPGSPGANGLVQSVAGVSQAAISVDDLAVAGLLKKTGQADALSVSLTDGTSSVPAAINRGVFYQQSGAANVATRTTQDKVRDTFAVKDFNIGVNVQDDTAALQAAINEAMKYGRRFRMPYDRDLYITSPLIVQQKPLTTPPATTVPDDIHFMTWNPLHMLGEGRRKIKAAPNFTGNCLINFVFDSANSYPAPLWSAIENLNLDGSGLAQYGVISNYCMNVIVRANGIQGVQTGIQFIGYGAAKIERNAFKTTATAIEQIQGGGDTWIEKNDFYCNTYVIDMGPRGGNTTIRSNVFNRDDASMPTTAYPVAVRISADNTVGAARQIRITDNEFSGMDVGVVAAGYSATQRDNINLIIRDNHLIPSAGGAQNTMALCQISNASEVSITGNTIGSRYLSTPTSTRANPAISLTNCSDVSVNDNIFANLYRPALIAGSCTGLSFSGNALRNVAQEGASSPCVYLSAVTDSVISGNTATQDSASYGQTFIQEASGSTRNKGVGNALNGIPTLGSLASGSTSTYVDISSLPRADAAQAFTAAQIAQLLANVGQDGAETTIASAATTDLGTAATLSVAITGTTTITSFGTAAKRLRLIRFTGALTLTHNATSLILPGATNIVTAAGDTCTAISDASGNWRVREYMRAGGSPIVVPSGAFTSYTPTVTAGSGTFTSVSATGRYQQTGKRVDIQVGVTITTNGTAAGAILVSLPVTPVASATYMLFGREDGATGAILQGKIAGSNLAIYNASNGYAGGNGYVLSLSGFYEAA